jgi:hypothetical protein
MTNPYRASPTVINHAARIVAKYYNAATRARDFIIDLDTPLMANVDSIYDKLHSRAELVEEAFCELFDGVDRRWFHEQCLAAMEK